MHAQLGISPLNRILINDYVICDPSLSYLAFEMFVCICVFFMLFEYWNFVTQFSVIDVLLACNALIVYALKLVSHLCQKWSSVYCR